MLSESEFSFGWHLYFQTCTAGDIDMASVFLLLTQQGRNTRAIKASHVLVTGLDNKLNLVQRMGRRGHTYNPTMKDKAPFAMSVSLLPSWVKP